MKALAPLILLLFALPAGADTLRVAVAANFSNAAQSIARAYQAQGHDQLQLAFGSTGKHYAQIAQGAPFDVFLAADAERPERLESEGLAVPGSRFSYAIGQLVLWSPRADLVDDAGRVLLDGGFKHLAIANPRLAPYGRAAQQVLEHLGLWELLQPQLVRGENIGQTFHYVRGGGAELGFVALSQLEGARHSPNGSQWRPPAELYEPIEQQAVLLRDSPAARNFLTFLKSDTARAIISNHGYRVP